MNTKQRVLLLASRPLEHSGLTKIEMDVIDYCKDVLDFDVACGFGFDNEYGNRLREKGIPCIPLPAKKRIISYGKAIFRTVRSGTYSKVYIHGNSSMMVLEALPSKLAGCFVVTHCHNTKPDRASFYYYLAKPLFNAVVDCKIGCSKRSSEWAYWGKRVQTVANGVDLGRFSFAANTHNAVRTKLDWENATIVGHIGAFNEQKNHERLIRIFAEIKRQDRSAKLLLIGTGDKYDEIKQHIESEGLSDDVRIIEHVTDPQDYLQAMDVVVMPSKFEGLCLVALEAQACGTPILVSDVFAEETFVTPSCKKLSLSESDKIWAQTALQLKDSPRRDATSTFIAKGMDFTSMMDKIKRLLTQ